MAIFFGLGVHRGWAPGRRAERGALLILVLAVLFIISLLGIVFLTFQGVEQLVSKSYSDTVRASFICQAGLQDAISRLSPPPDSPPPAPQSDAALWSPGDLIKYTQVGGLHQPKLNGEQIYYGYVPSPAPAYPTARPGLPLEWANRPSYRALDATQTAIPSYLVEALTGPPATQYQNVTGVADTGLRGASGYMEFGKYGPRTEVYALRVQDESALLNVNDGVEFGVAHSVSQNLKRILNKLGQVLSPQIASLGDRVVNNRPQYGYTDAIQLRDTLVTAGLTVDEANRASRYLTVYSWKDGAVANPVPLSAAVAGPAGYPNANYAVGYVRPTYDFPFSLSGTNLGLEAVYRFGYDRAFADHPSNAISAKNYMRFYDPAVDPAANTSTHNFHNGIYDHRSLNPVWVEVVKRAPVNANTAPREVLVSLLHGLQGFFTSIERRRSRPINFPSAFGSYEWLRNHMTYDQSGTYTTTGNTANSTSDGDECGFLYTTMRYWDENDAAWNGATMIGARLIADEIIACRERVACSAVHTANSTPVPGLHPVTDYAGAGVPQTPFSGPFRSWSQFYAFVDHLVNVGVIAEKRTAWFFDYYQSGTKKPAGSSVQLRLAAEAMGDVLKANFNPNLHLNELNPNRNLYLHVDKTDLLVNSTEFCFLPINGTYTVESLGRVLAPPSGSPPSDPFTSGLVFQVLAEKKLRATFSLWYGAVRHTTQAQFYPGTFGPRVTATIETNNNFAVETGPEVDNGPITTLGMDQQTRWDGYVQLSTYGGNYHTGTQKPKDQYRVTIGDASTYPGMTNTGLATQFSSSIHNHFTYDFTAHSHAGNSDGFLDWPFAGLGVPPWSLALQFGHTGNHWGLSDIWGTNDNINNNPTLKETGFLTTQVNLPAYCEPMDGPYGPAEWNPAPSQLVITPQHRYRSSRSFTIGNPDGPPGAWNMGNSYAFPAGLAVSAPSDLRVDGLYAQRGSSMGHMEWDWEAWQNLYGDQTSISKSAWRFMEGTAAFWLKPNWFPECTGKPRILYAAARPRYHITARLWLVGPNLSGYGGIGPDHPTVWSNGMTETTTNTPAFECNDPSFANPSPFTLFYMPAHMYNSGSPPAAQQPESGIPAYNANGKFRPASLGFGVGLGRRNNAGMNWSLSMVRHPWASGAVDLAKDSGGNALNNSSNTYGSFAHYHAAVVTPSLNHEDHGAPNPDTVRGPDGGFNYLRGHEWTHVMVNWKVPYQSGLGQPSDVQILVNGQVVTDTTGISDTTHLGADNLSISQAVRVQLPQWWISPILWDVSGTPGFYSPAWQWQNTIVTLGGVTDWPINQYGINSTKKNIDFITDGYKAPMNYTADATFDEFFLWTNRNATSPGGMYYGPTLWRRGRYYRPNDGNATDGTFTSVGISLPAPGTPIRTLPAAGGATPPGGGSMVGIVAPPQPAPRAVGISWTAYGEAVNPTAYGAFPAAVGKVMIPYMRDWNVTPSNGGPGTVAVNGAPAEPNGFLAVSMIDMYVTNLSTGATVGPLRNEHFSRTILPVAAGQQVAYLAKFRVGQIDMLNSILLSSPILDDVTLYYSLGGPRILMETWEPSQF